MDGKSEAEAALQEAWEEAGVKDGKVAEAPVSQYVGEKRFDDGRRLSCKTRVYAVEVTDTKKSFPEAKRRDRRWVPLDKAKDLIDDAGMRAALDQI